MSYVIAGYGITAVVLAAYATRVVRRGRAISRILPPAANGKDGDTGRGWK